MVTDNNLPETLIKTEIKTFDKSSGVKKKEKTYNFNQIVKFVKKYKDEIKNAIVFIEKDKIYDISEKSQNNKNKIISKIEKIEVSNLDNFVTKINSENNIDKIEILNLEKPVNKNEENKENTKINLNEKNEESRKKFEQIKKYVESKSKFIYPFSQKNLECSIILEDIENENKTFEVENEISRDYIEESRERSVIENDLNEINRVKKIKNLISFFENKTW